MRDVAESGERLLAQLFGDGVDAGGGGRLEHKRGVAQQFGTLRGPRGVRSAHCGSHATVEVAGEEGCPAERDEHPAPLDVG